MIEQFRSNRFAQRILETFGVIRVSFVVLAELLRGAKGREELRTLQSLERNLTLLTPTEKSWIESGQVLAKMRSEHGFTPEKLRDLHFDVLIALTARSYGAKLITSNRGDFERDQRHRAFDLAVW